MTGLINEAPLRGLKKLALAFMPGRLGDGFGEI